MCVVASRVLPAAWLLATLAWPTAAVAQAPLAASATTYRVFLATGEPLPSYGEPALVGDRVIFNLLIGSADDVRDMQLVSLPASGVDTDRTARYVHAMRAVHYAATRGDADYAALTAEVARVLDELAAATDAGRRLALAESAQRSLLAWSADHFQYRAADIHELAALFDDVITELRAAAGRPGVSLTLVAGEPPLEPLLPEPTARESVALALAAARTADVGAERVDILRRAADVAEKTGNAAAARTAEATLAEEVRAGTAYASLIAALRTRADAARRRGDVAAVERLADELDRRDRQLGRRRPAEVQALSGQLSAAVEATRAFRRALDEHTRQLGALRRYDSQIRPLLARFDLLATTLIALRDMRGITPNQLTTVETTVQQVLRDLATIRPPAAQLSVHATFESVLRMAHEASQRRRLATSSQAAEMREASAAASGALLRGGQVRRDLAASLRRPAIQ